MKTLLFTLSILTSIVVTASPDSVVVARCYFDDGLLSGYTYTIDRYDSMGNLVLHNYISESSFPVADTYTYENTQVANTWDALGNLVYSVSQSLDTSGGWTTQSIHHYLYDASNNLIADSIVGGDVFLYTWDANNDTLAYYHMYFDGVNYTLYDSTHIIRNGLGQAIEREYYSTTPVFRHTYQYDAAGNNTLQVVESHLSASWENYQMYTWQYDSLNLLTASSLSQWNSTYWDLKDTFNITFTPTHKIASSMHYTENASDADSLYQVYSYDVNDSLSQIDQYHYLFPSMDSDSIRVIISRDASGYIADSMGFQNIGGSYQSVWNYHHDLSAMPDTDFIFMLNCNGIVCTDTVDLIYYTYDPAGNFQTYSLNHYTGSVGVDLGIAYGTIYNASGQVISHFEDNWEPGSHHHLNETFAYNSSGLLVHSYNSHSGSLGIPMVTNCYFEYYSSTGSLDLAFLSGLNIDCSGRPFPGFLLITGGMPPYQITWNDTTGISNANTTLPIFFPHSAMSYIATVQDANGDTASVSFSVVSSGQLLNMGPDTTICTGQTLALTAPPGYVSHSWMQGVMADTFYVSSPTPDTIPVILTVMDSVGCLGTDSMWVIVDVCSGIPEPSTGIIVYSMPDSYRIVFPSGRVPLYYSLYNAEGKLISAGKTITTELTLPFSNKSSGIYFLKLTGNKWSEIIRLAFGN